MADAQADITTLVVLGLVALEPGSGYDLARLAERSVGYLWAPSRSQIYQVLPRLLAHRLATAKRISQRDRPDKAVYSITPTGRRMLRRWLSEVDDEPSGGVNVFALKLFFCDLVPTQTAQMQLDGYRRFLESRLSRFRAMSRTPSQGENVFPQLVLRRAIVRIEATLGWSAEASNALAATRPDTEAAARQAHRRTAQPEGGQFAPRDAASAPPSRRG
jgi:DNA-binding PadR family transcriptional regulator